MSEDGTLCSIASIRSQVIYTICSQKKKAASRPRGPQQVKLAATFWNNLGAAALLGVFLVPAFYTRHTMLQQALSIGVGLAAAIGLRMLAHWRLTRLRD